MCTRIILCIFIVLNMHYSETSKCVFKKLIDDGRQSWIGCMLQKRAKSVKIKKLEKLLEQKEAKVERYRMDCNRPEDNTENKERT